MKKFIKDAIEALANTTTGEIVKTVIKDSLKSGACLLIGREICKKIVEKQEKKEALPED